MRALTHLEWNCATGGLEVAKAFADRIRGKNVLITGVSPESISSSIALSFASQAAALIILASRTKSKLEQVHKSIKVAYPDVHVKIVLMDLLSQESVKNAANEVSQLTGRLDIIINNAGFLTKQRQTTKEGIEGQFGANHIGHFLLTNLLMRQLLSSASSSTPGATRVINLTSLGYQITPVRFSDYNLEKRNEDIPEEERHGQLLPAFEKGSADGYNGWVAYGQSKTANILFSVGINEKFGPKGVKSYAVHPGLVWSGMSHGLDAEEEATLKQISNFEKNHDQGASTVMVAALDPALNKPKGVLLHDCQMWDALPYATDPKIAERLWNLSKTLVQKYFELGEEGNGNEKL
ncbi:Short-chain dehydrogenase TIC 32 chloroplastic [Pyrenophora seminiperda CCB06]|uniref:Short-chain dehydrogenase TIC 32 chloroplastic n=1 Tax=Pyrenophora seminiperda CCB06 TaxID=1302712 RepID=A0A3M7M760_9PLEO|nr:Short-chain dehydrogenase TIC 32 chloroplastic [Pyrenophora seminiperda CCB06]